MGFVRDAEFGGNSVIWSSSFRPEFVVILGVQGLHGLMFLILISHMFAFFKRLISAKPECSPGGGGGGSLVFSASNFHPQKYQEFQAPKNILPELTYIYENIRYPPSPPGECSCIVIPEASSMMRVLSGRSFY